jgi:hypothetical protein
MRSSRPLGRALFACLALGAASACSLLIDVSGEQCTTDADCVARGASAATTRCVRSACVDTVLPVEAGPIVEAGADAEAGPLPDQRYVCLPNHPAPAPTKATAAYSVTLTDSLSTKPIAGLRVKLCPNLTDPNCTAPAATTTTDALGVARFTIDTSSRAFDGYVDVDPEGADGGAAVVDGGEPDTYVPSRIYYTSIPIAEDRKDDYELQKFSTLAVFSALFKVKVDLAFGVVFLIAQDCNFQDSAGISLLLDQSNTETQSFYLQAGQPSTTAAVTDSSGIAGFFNVTTGTRRFTTQLADTKRKVGELSAYMRPGTVLFAKIGPSFTP